MEFLEVEKYTALQTKHKNYIRELMNYCKGTPRHPKFHIHPPCGLLNDPNGLAYFQGKYHVFYQWFPFGPEHGMKHWAHVTSENLLDWNWSEEMLVPDQEYEKNGCYSGNSIEADGKLYLFYTANYKSEQGKIPKQAMAWMEADGTIHKYEKNPIIDEIPEGLTGEIRDPFVFEKNGYYYMMLGGGSLEGKAKLLLYRSKDLKNWGYQGTIDVLADGLEFGYMFECPSYIQVDGKDVLFLSLMGKKPEGDRYHNEFSSLYFVGNLDLENLCFEVESYDEIDKGFDFYAPQVFYGKNREPMMFAWFGCGVQDLPYAKEDMWIHALTMPRKLSLKNGKLYQKVPKEISGQYPEIVWKEQQIIPQNDTWKLSIDLQENPCSIIQIGNDDDCIKLFIEKETGFVIADRSSLKQKVCEKYGTVRRLQIDSRKLSNIDVYFDNSFYEICVNKGEEIMTLRAFPENVFVKIK